MQCIIVYRSWSCDPKLPAAEEDNYPLQLRHLFLPKASAGLVIVTSTYEAEDRTNSRLVKL